MKQPLTLRARLTLLYGALFLVAMRAPFLWLLVFSYTGKMIAACVGAASTLPRRVSASSFDA